MGCAVFWLGGGSVCKYDVSVDCGPMRYFRLWQTNGQTDGFLTLPHVCLHYFETSHETGWKNMGQSTQPKSEMSNELN